MNKYRYAPSLNSCFVALFSSLIGLVILYFAYIAWVENRIKLMMILGIIGLFIALYCSRDAFKTWKKYKYDGHIILDDHGFYYPDYKKREPSKKYISYDQVKSITDNLEEYGRSFTIELKNRDSLNFERSFFKGMTSFIDCLMKMNKMMKK